MTADSVLQTIQTLHREGRLPKNIRQADDVFYRVARKHFGSWEDALIAAGVKRHARRRWTKHAILQAVRERHRQGLPMATLYKEDRGLTISAARQFGSWQTALAAAGLQPYRRIWSKALVVQEIQAWHEKDVPLSRIWKEDIGLYAGAKRFFGTWQEALQAAGFRQTRRSWSKEKVVAAIRARHEAGLPVRNMKQHDLPLHGAAEWHFGSWYKAILAASLKPHATDRWTKRRVIEEIQDWHQRGVPVGKVWEQDGRLIQAATRLFGNWREALRAAGLQSPRQVWSKERVINELQVHRPQRLPWKRLVREHLPLVAAASRYFGTWHNALVTAGLRQGPPKRFWSWNKQAVLEAIRARHQKGLPLSTTARDDTRLCAAAKRHFGSWRKALKAAGFSVQAARQWSADAVIRELQNRHAQGLPMVNVSHLDRSLCGAAKRRFGSWAEAMRAAKLPYQPRQTWTRQSVIDAIRSRHERGLLLSRVWAEDRPLFRAAVRKFGNWECAVRATGLEPRLRRKWSKERVVAGLRAWHRHSNENLRRVDPALAGTAARLFGSLDAACEVAGIERTTRRWSKKRIIQAVQDGYVRGRSLNTSGFGNQRLLNAAKRHFGSWSAAVAAAGLAHKYTSPAPTTNWNAEKILDGIRRWHAEGRYLPDVRKEEPRLYWAAKDCFGGWRAAVIAAGVEPTRKRWSKKKVVAEIRARCERGASLVSTLVFREDPPLAGAATRLFGTWRKAVEVATEKDSTKTRKGK